MKKQLTALYLLFCVFAASSWAQPIRCDICGQAVEGGYHTAKDRVTGEKKIVCKACHKLENKCFVCNLPVKNDCLKLLDGRCLCSREAQEAINSDDDVRTICAQVRDDLDRLFSRFLTFPETNVVISVGDKIQMDSLIHAPGYDDACVTVFGATHTSPMPGGRFLYHISLLSYMRKSRLMAVCAHEFTHTWINENVGHDRKALLNRNSLEGFCELVAYKYMESRQETAEMQNIQKNNYTRGQIEVLIEANKKYGFDAVMEWIKSGEDNKLELDNLDRVRVLRDAAPAGTPSVVPALLYVPPAAPSPVPDTLKLKGISGVPQHRFALINNTTFEAGERRKVRVGETDVTVQCLEIRDKSVVIQVGKSNERKDLFLQKGE